MRNYVILILAVLSFASCKTSGVKEQAEGKTCGMVSHQYRSGGCPTVIIINKTGEEPIVLIPKDPLPAGIDKDNTLIRFDQTTLRMPNPAGCVKGIPALISNISKTKK